jgi:hypothetical protein
MRSEEERFMRVSRINQCDAGVCGRKSYPFLRLSTFRALQPDVWLRFAIQIYEAGTVSVEGTTTGCATENKAGGRDAHEVHGVRVQALSIRIKRGEFIAI